MIKPRQSDILPDDCEPVDEGEYLTMSINQVEDGFIVSYGDEERGIATRVFVDDEKMVGFIREWFGMATDLRQVMPASARPN